MRVNSEEGIFDQMVRSESSDSDTDTIAKESIKRSDQETEKTEIDKLSLHPISKGNKTFEKDISNN